MMMQDYKKVKGFDVFLEMGFLFAFSRGTNGLEMRRSKNLMM